jgi:hypothetical protein
MAFIIDAFAKTHGMAKQKFRATRLGGFSGAKAYIRYVEILKKRRNAGRTFCDAIIINLFDRHDSSSVSIKMFFKGCGGGDMSGKNTVR